MTPTQPFGGPRSLWCDSPLPFTPKQCIPIGVSYDHTNNHTEHNNLAQQYNIQCISSDFIPCQKAYYGLIFVEDQNHSAPIWSSGVLIGPNLVLTTAHTIYDAKNKRKYDKITFYPAVYSKNNITHYGKAEAKRAYFPDTFEKAARVVAKDDEEGEDIGRYNYGLLVLDEAIGYKTGYLGLQS